MFASSCSITRFAHPPKSQFTRVNEQFWGKHNEVSGRDGTNTKYKNKKNRIKKTFMYYFIGTTLILVVKYFTGPKILFKYSCKCS
jgi:hypothetical protein